MTTRTVSLLLLTLLAGCSANPIKPSKFECPRTNGVTCMSATEVYEHSLVYDTIEAPVARSTSTGRQSMSFNVEEEDGSLSLVALDPPAAPAPSTPVAGAPLRTEAKVLRIWFAPWEDTRGDLHLPGYVYSEIEHRTWRVGEVAPSPRPGLRRLLSPAATQVADAASVN